MNYKSPVSCYCSLRTDGLINETLLNLEFYVYPSRVFEINQDHLYMIETNKHYVVPSRL